MANWSHFTVTKYEQGAGPHNTDWKVLHDGRCLQREAMAIAHHHEIRGAHVLVFRGLRQSKMIHNGGHTTDCQCGMISQQASN